MSEDKRDVKVYVNEREFLRPPPFTDYVKAYIERDTRTYPNGNSNEYWTTCLELGDGECRSFHFDAGGINTHPDEQHEALENDLKALNTIIDVMTKFRDALKIAIDEHDPDKV